MRILVAALLLVAACGSQAEMTGISSRSARGPDGTSNWFYVSCMRAAHEYAAPIEGCIDEAGKICLHGYETANQGPHHMLVKCKRRAALEN